MADGAGADGGGVGGGGVPSEAGRFRITPTAVIGLDELDWRFTGSGGPGGQHANTANTRVEVRLDVRACSLPPEQRARVEARLGPVVRAVAADTRSQSRNRELALERLRTRLAAALATQRPRRPTKAGRAAREARLSAKARRSETKRQRRPPRPDDL